MSRSATVSTRWSRRLMRKGGILPFEEAGCKAYVGTRHHGPSAPAFRPNPRAGRVPVEDERSTSRNARSRLLSHGLRSTQLWWMELIRPSTLLRSCPGDIGRAFGPVRLRKNQLEQDG